MSPPLGSYLSRFFYIIEFKLKLVGTHVIILSIVYSYWIKITLQSKQKYRLLKHETLYLVLGFVAVTGEREGKSI